MLHTKTQGHWPFGSLEDFVKFFTIYEHSGHLGHVTRNICANFLSPTLGRLPMKSELNWPCGLSDMLTDGHQRHRYTNRLPVCLQLR